MASEIYKTGQNIDQNSVTNFLLPHQSLTNRNFDDFSLKFFRKTVFLIKDFVHF